MGDADFAAGDGRADGVGIGLAVALQGRQPRQFGRAPDLLQIDPEPAEKAIGVGAERGAPSVSPARAAQPELVAHRPVYQDFPDHQAKTLHQRRPFARAVGDLDPLGEAAEGFECPALQPTRIGGANPQLGQHVLPDPRRRQCHGRPQFAQIALDGFGAFRAIAGKADEQGQHQ